MSVRCLKGCKFQHKGSSTIRCSPSLMEPLIRTNSWRWSLRAPCLCCTCAFLTWEQKNKAACCFWELDGWQLRCLPYGQTSAQLWSQLGVLHQDTTVLTINTQGRSCKAKAVRHFCKQSLQLRVMKVFQGSGKTTDCFGYWVVVFCCCFVFVFCLFFFSRQGMKQQQKKSDRMWQEKFR